jgi:fructose-1,6-bisphosphatase/inositol monophosphatase family enzyme
VGGAAGPLSAASTVVAARDQVSAEVGEEVVILNFRDEVYYGLDGAGAYLWERMRDPVSVSELRDAVVAAFAVDAETAERDILALLREMVERGMVEVR